ncbi:hypothetical protein EHO61_05055 [Leptospira fluminis]|uniref:Uncharacterized protein n=1 Tax=Leptospira fluminis TaxID=2484979 RepID=A0A4R9GSL0_9LEPT|nr:hypothetical protein [Leptospira fluminis]TGK21216.1 hypothetical protein EHO61_05055 [Leptospira fluminis]
MNLLRKIPGWEKGTLLLGKLQEFSFTKKLFIVYSIFALYFLLYHESHLPLFWMVSLALVGYLASTVLFWGIVYSYRKLEAKVVIPAIITEVGISRPTTALVPWIEAALFLISILICYSTEFFANRSGLLFFIIYCIGALSVRFLENKIYYKAGFLGVLILASGLGSFKALQFTENWVAYILFKPAFQEKDLTRWNFDETTRMVSNPDLKLSLKLPEDFYFHNPKNLTWENKTGTGQIAGIISTSDSDPNRYPYIRIFYVPQPYVEIDPLISEFKKYLDLLVSRGDIEELNELEHEDFDNRYSGKFWTFYDVLRPRYAKTGIFVLSETNEGDSLLFNVTESLIKDRRHEESVEAILTSVRRE